MSAYMTSRDNECGTAYATNNCPTAGQIHCMSGIGTCKCNDGTFCAWGPTYSVNCPCA